VCLCYLASCFETSGKYIYLFSRLIQCTHGNAFGRPESLGGYDQHIRLLVVTLSAELCYQLQTTSLQILVCYLGATPRNWPELTNMLWCVRQICFGACVNYVLVRASNMFRCVPQICYGACLKYVMVRASNMLWCVRQICFGACVKYVLVHASNMLWCVHQICYGVCVKYVMVRASNMFWCMRQICYGASVKYVIVRASNMFWCVRQISVSYVKLLNFYHFL